MTGWIKLHRTMLDKAFYRKDSQKVHFWVHILLKANHAEREELLGGKPFLCQPGQFTTGRKQLSLETGISESKIERMLSYFEETEQQIEQQKTSSNRLITVKNWKLFQEGEHRFGQPPDNNSSSNEPPPNNNQAHYKNTNKNNNRINAKNMKNKTLLSEVKDSDVPDENKEVHMVARSFQELIINNLKMIGIENSDIKKVSAQKGWETVRLMLESDKRTHDELREVFEFLRDEIPKHGFSWKQNIHSLSKLREKFEQILITSKNSKNNGKFSKPRTKSDSSVSDEFKRSVFEGLQSN